MCSSWWTDILVSIIRAYTYVVVGLECMLGCTYTRGQLVVFVSSDSCCWHGKVMQCSTPGCWSERWSDVLDHHGVFSARWGWRVGFSSDMFWWIPCESWYLLTGDSSCAQASSSNFPQEQKKSKPRQGSCGEGSRNRCLALNSDLQTHRLKQIIEVGCFNTLKMLLSFVPNIIQLFHVKNDTICVKAIFDLLILWHRNYLGLLFNPHSQNTYNMLFLLLFILWEIFYSFLICLLFKYPNNSFITKGVKLSFHMTVS